MERCDFELLTNPNTANIIEQYIDSDPHTVALTLRSAAIASHIKVLQRCRAKLPTYYEARCVVSQIAFQQCSSESTARSKCFGGGALAVDLTCGLGVDSWALAATFDRVVSVEIDPLRADVARYNFERLAVHNIEVVCSSAEDFQIPQGVDLIYIDPSRENSDGKRIYSLQESSPNILELMPRLRALAKAVTVKLSPLYDVQQGFRDFTDAAIEVISLDGECKEVLVHVGYGSKAGTVSCTAIRGGNVERIVFDSSQIGQTATIESTEETFKYLHLPDVAFYKTRTIEAYRQKLNRESNQNVVLRGGYLFSDQPLKGFIGRTYHINRTLPYQPKNIKKILKEQGIKRANIHLKEFEYSAANIAKSLGIELGGREELFFTRIARQSVVFFVSLQTIK